ncbi:MULTISPECIES: 1-phosphofructokinase family hexose kinase [unclassified Eubacterium (in: firmicutes)]|uniref:1-phosphofructokinase family hexose kinase n=1 Tax=unclassified Eubacterium (in: firmicutes) TaxID=2624479 RepID=UPI001566BC06|nr:MULTISPECIES: 1-phosphofructokinase family hexose kinase [unclassified Eubacterium (in: firmicutes)]
MIHTLTLNPAVDKILYMKQYIKNTNNRVKKVTCSLGGKGTHVSMNLSQMGTQSNAFGFAYGQNGEFILDLLRQENVHPEFVYAKQPESRTCYLVVEDSGDSTLISEKGPVANEGQVAELFSLMDKSIQEGDYLVLSGDSSNFSDPLIYNHVLDRMADKKLKVFLDTSGSSFKECIQKSPYLIKPNVEELQELVGRKVESEKDIIEAIRQLDKYRIEIIAVSMGKRGSVVKIGDRFYRARPPKVNVFNTIGCGDCFLAGLVFGTEQGYKPEQLLRFATAVSASTAESPLSFGFNVERAKQLMPLVTIMKI